MTVSQPPHADAPPGAPWAAWSAREIAAAAAAIGIAIPAQCLPGVGANLALLAGHARIAFGAEAGD